MKKPFIDEDVYEIQNLVIAKGDNQAFGLFFEFIADKWSGCKLYIEQKNGAYYIRLPMMFETNSILRYILDNHF